MKSITLALVSALSFTALTAHAGLKEDKVKTELERQMDRIKGDLITKLDMSPKVSVDWAGLGEFCKELDETYCKGDGTLGYAFRNALEIPLRIADNGAKAAEAKALKAKVKAIRLVKGTGKATELTFVDGTITVHFPVAKGADTSTGPAQFSKWRKTVQDAL